MAALTALAIGSAVATVAGGVASYQQGRGANDIAKEQARVAIAKGNIERFQQAQESEKVRKAATAQAGKGGGSLSGSYLENLNASMTNAQLDAEMISYNSEVAAANFRQEGKNAKAAGLSSLIGSVASAGASAAGSGIFSSGAENMAGQATSGVLPGIKPTF